MLRVPAGVGSTRRHVLVLRERKQPLQLRLKVKCKFGVKLHVVGALPQFRATLLQATVLQMSHMERHRSTSCCRPPSQIYTAESKFGVYPYAVMPATNESSYILYFTITLAADACEACRGSYRRAWLVLPEAAGEAVRIRCGGCECGAVPPQGLLETFMAGTDADVPKTAPVVFAVRVPLLDTTLYMGCTESGDGDGVLLWAADSCAAGPATDSWFLLPPPNCLQQTIMTGVASAAKSWNGRQLRAVRTDIPCEYTLAWKPASDPVGFRVRLTLVSPQLCPCDDDWEYGSFSRPHAAMPFTFSSTTTTIPTPCCASGRQFTRRPTHQFPGVVSTPFR